MSCEEAMALMSARLDGELDPEQTQALEAHLQGCADCRRLLSAMEGLDQKLSQLREPAPQGLKQGVLYRIDQATGKVKKPRLRRWFGPGTALGAVAAVLVLLVGLGVIPLGQKASAPADGAAELRTEGVAELPTPAQEPGDVRNDWADLRKGDEIDAAPQEAETQGAETQYFSETGAAADSYYMSGGESTRRGEAKPLSEELRSACQSLSREEDSLVLLYTEFSPESLFTLLETEEPRLYELVRELRPRETEGELLVYDTDCATALALQEWLLERLPHSEIMGGNAQEAEISLRIRMEKLDPESGSLYRVISFEPPSRPVSWPETWPEGWALRLRTEENWSFFFPAEDYAPGPEKPALLVFPRES